MYEEIKLDELLYDNKVNIYPYQQYSDHIGIDSIFKYFDTKIKQMREYIILWMIFKSNQKLNDDVYLAQEYFTYLVKWYYGLPEVFGSPRNKYQWDINVNWDRDGVKWDDINSTGVLDVNKVKSIMRLIQNINQIQFNIDTFIDFCNEFCYLAEDVDIFVTDTSFKNPEEIIIYYSKDSQEVVELQKIILTFKDILPMYSITLKLFNSKKK